MDPGFRRECGFFSWQRHRSTHWDFGIKSSSPGFFEPDQCPDQLAVGLAPTAADNLGMQMGDGGAGEIGLSGPQQQGGALDAVLFHELAVGAAERFPGPGRQLLGAFDVFTVDEDELVAGAVVGPGIFGHDPMGVPKEDRFLMMFRQMRLAERANAVRFDLGERLRIVATRASSGILHVYRSAHLGLPYYRKKRIPGESRDPFIRRRSR